jgi:hypothetical protein
VTRIDAGDRAFLTVRSYIATVRTQGRNPSMLAARGIIRAAGTRRRGSVWPARGSRDPPVIAGSRSAFPCLYRVGRRSEPTAGDRDGSWSTPSSGAVAGQDWHPGPSRSPRRLTDPHGRLLLPGCCPCACVAPGAFEGRGSAVSTLHTTSRPTCGRASSLGPSSAGNDTTVTGGTGLTLPTEGARAVTTVPGWGTPGACSTGQQRSVPVAHGALRPLPHLGERRLAEPAEAACGLWHARGQRIGPVGIHRLPRNRQKPRSRNKRRLEPVTAIVRCPTC